LRAAGYLPLLGRISNERAVVDWMQAYGLTVAASTKPRIGPTAQDARSAAMTQLLMAASKHFEEKSNLHVFQRSASESDEEGLTPDWATTTQVPQATATSNLTEVAPQATPEHSPEVEPDVDMGQASGSEAPAEAQEPAN
jgi:hypothetical protein